MRILVIDIGGTAVKIFGENGDEPLRLESGASLTPEQLVAQVSAATADAGIEYDVVSLGYPGAVANRKPIREPGNLGNGWLDYDFQGTFGTPVRIVNDAVLQALGAYDRGRMLFLGLGTGVGSVLIAERVICPLELGELPLRDASLAETLGRHAREARDRAAWADDVRRVSGTLRRAFAADYVVVGGGHAADVDNLPANVRRGSPRDAYAGGHRLWAEPFEQFDQPASRAWRIVAAGRTE